MGISGLLQGLKNASSSEGNVQDFAGQALAVDASSWLHKSVYGIADHYVEEVEQRGVPDQRSVRTCCSYVEKRCSELLTFARIRRVYLVMDGKRCPLKASTNQSRDDRRRENLEEARRLRRAGNKQAMYEKYKACIKVHPDLGTAVAADVERHFAREKQVQVVWAPYEADAQMVKLCLDGLAQAIITEDSDVLVYTAACQVPIPILFKLDRNSGKCTVTSVDWLLNGSGAAALESEQNQNQRNNHQKKSKKKKGKAPPGLDPILQAFATRQSRSPGLGARLFVQACVLAGCDYSPNQLAGVGLVSAFRHIQSSIHRASGDRFRHALNLLPSKTWTSSVRKIEYEELLAKSEAVFYYHPVRQADGRVHYLADPNQGDLADRHVPDLERFGGDWTFLGDLASETENDAPADNNSNPERRDVNNKRKRGLPPPPPRPAPERSDDPSAWYMYGNKPNVPKVVTAISNPYKQSKKQKTTKEPQQQNKKNPIAHLFGAARAAATKKSTTTQQLPPKKKTVGGPLDNFFARQDVRFVKRDFSKSIQKPKLPSGRVAGSRVFPHRKVGPLDLLLGGGATNHRGPSHSSRQQGSDLPAARRPPPPPAAAAAIDLTESHERSDAQNGYGLSFTESDRAATQALPPPELGSETTGAGVFAETFAGFSGPPFHDDDLPIGDAGTDRAFNLPQGSSRYSHVSAGGDGVDDSRQQAPSFDYGLSHGDSLMEARYDRHWSDATAHVACRDEQMNAPLEDALCSARSSEYHPPYHRSFDDENSSPNKKAPSAFLSRASMPSGLVQGLSVKPKPVSFPSYTEDDDRQLDYMKDSVYDPSLNPAYDLPLSYAEDQTTSKYFGGQQELNRRVTMESPDTKPSRAYASLPQNLGQPWPDATGFQQGPTSNTCPLYDDFFESPVTGYSREGDDELLEDEIVDSPESTKGVPMFRSKNRGTRSRGNLFAPPKPNSCIGPSKTIRYRFGPLA